MARYSVFSDAFWCRTYEDIELDQIEDCDQAGPSSSRTSAAAPLPLPLPPRPESKWSDDSSRVEPMHRRFRLRIAGQLPRLSPLRLRAESPVRNEENETPVEGADGLPHAESEIPKPRNGFEVAREQTEGPDLQPPQLLLPPPVSQVPRTHIAVHRHRTWTGRVLHRYTPVLPSQRTPRPPRWPSFNPFNHRDRSEPREEESPIVSKSRASLGHITICLSHFCAHAGIGQTLPLLRAIAIHFNIVDVTHLSMMVSGYALALAVYILVARKLSLVFDPKKIFILGLVWSAIWTIVAGAAFYGSVPGLIASRSSQGLGIAFTLPTGLLLLKKVDPPWISNATKYLIYHMMAPVGLVVGALGASVLGLTWWPRAYWAYLCVLAMLSILGGLTLPSGGSDNTDTQRSLSDFVSSFDLAGMITGVGSLYLIGFAWTQAGIVGWDAPYLYIIGSVGISVGVAFVLVEKFYACDPLVPQSVQSWKVIHILFVVAVGSSSFGIWLFYGWQFLQSLALVSPLISTAYHLPLLFIGCAGIVNTRFLPLRLPPDFIFCATSLETLIGCILLATRPFHQIFWGQHFVSILLLGCGHYTRNHIAIDLVSTWSNGGDPELSATLVNLAAYYGIAIGLGIAGTVQHRVASGRLSLPTRFKGYQGAFWTSVGLAGVGVVASLVLSCLLRRWLIPGRRMRSGQDEADEAGSREPQWPYQRWLSLIIEMRRERSGRGTSRRATTQLQPV